LRAWGCTEQHHNEIRADLEPIALIQPIRPIKAIGLPYKKRAVGGFVRQPPRAFPEIHVEMVAGDEPRRIRQHPVIAAGPPHAQGPPGAGNLYRAAAFQAAIILNS
jgi:hypothetical protein